MIRYTAAFALPFQQVHFDPIRRMNLEFVTVVTALIDHVGHSLLFLNKLALFLRSDCDKNFRLHVVVKNLKKKIN